MTRCQGWCSGWGYCYKSALARVSYDWVRVRVRLRVRHRVRVRVRVRVKARARARARVSERNLCAS